VEEQTERDIAQKIEDPVHQFLANLRSPDFVMTDGQREAMTRYVSLLFSRSRARREGTKHIQKLIGIALEKFLANESQVLTVAAHWSLEQTFKGNPMWAGTRYVKRIATRLLEASRTPSSEQANFVAAIHNVINRLDEWMLEGEWKILATASNDPFIVSDSPVVTWERFDDGRLSYGPGFERPEVEVILPVSPLTCLHICPRVVRNRRTIQPTTEEVNEAQAAFAFAALYADRHVSAIDQLVRAHISTAKIGRDVFTLLHRNLDDLYYNILLSAPPFK
jgi:hypothetical protein